MDPEPERPLDQLVDSLLDVAVYAPIGLVMLAKDEIPKLAAQGRQRFESQAGVARMVGQLAVAQGKRQARGVMDRLRSKDQGATSEEDAKPRPRASGSARTTDEKLPVHVGENLPDVAGPTTVDRTEDAPSPPATSRSADDLPIPGYDSLSASQVVQRLPGLSPQELEAVRTYEEAGRARKTVLLRVAQLRAAS